MIIQLFLALIPNCFLNLVSSQSKVAKFWCVFTTDISEILSQVDSDGNIKNSCKRTDSTQPEYSIVWTGLSSELNCTLLLYQMLELSFFGYWVENTVLCVIREHPAADTRECSKGIFLFTYLQIYIVFSNRLKLLEINLYSYYLTSIGELERCIIRCKTQPFVVVITSLLNTPSNEIAPIQ